MLLHQESQCTPERGTQNCYYTHTHTHTHTHTRKKKKGKEKEKKKHTTKTHTKKCKCLDDSKLKHNTGNTRSSHSLLAVQFRSQKNGINHER